MALLCRITWLYFILEWLNERMDLLCDLEWMALVNVGERLKFLARCSASSKLSRFFLLNSFL